MDSIPSFVIPGRTKTFPTQEEISCGMLLAEYFKSKVEFLASDATSSKSPDFLICRLNQYWELKSIRGNSQNTIHHAFERSRGQSENLILSLRHSKIHTKTAISRIKREQKTGKNSKKRILVITKSDKILAIK
ncbi:hypothetical protein IJH89_00395 [Candidatus Saccharibacteria bacterium]|nr:hypothetical protein [Candidatus Saccharibacteria bacterium]